MKLKLNEIRQFFFRILPEIALGIFLIAGIIVYDDYGLSWDELAQMKDKGEPAYDFIISGDSDTYLKKGDVYQGPAFEVFLTAFQKILDITDSRTIYLFRHLVCFIFFWFSGLIFYFLLKQKYTDPFIIFIGICWYFLMPRIFADSFYNSKDIPFLGMTTICIWSMINFLEKPSWKWGFMHGLFCGFLIDIRLMGILLPAITLFVIFIKVLLSDKKAFSFLLPICIFLLSCLIFTIVFWPVLWIDPIYHLKKGWEAMSAFSWYTANLYGGKYVYSNALPWHYDIVWILITTPVQYISFFSIGFFFTCAKLFSFKREKILFAELEMIAFLILFIPITTIIILHSVEYDAWRHVFFLYVPLCIVAVSGLYHTKTILSKYFKPVWINSAILLLTLPVAYKMIEMHPYQNIYFNRFIGPDANSAKFRYEMDYWGLAFREALEKLNLKTQKEEISVYALNPPGWLSFGILPQDIRTKFKFYPYDEANYFITDYRWINEEFDELKRIDSIKVDGAVISSTYLLSDETRKVINFKAMNGKYVCANRTLNNSLFAHSDNAWEWETFSLRVFENNKCAVRSSEKLFLSAQLNNKSEITATRSVIGAWETFTMIELDSNYVAFKAANEKYLSVDENTLQIFANADCIGKNEKFRIIPGFWGFMKMTPN